ncbi:tail fiber assembly protein [Erwinia sp. QL-Z3]|uniref:tail fiber assembly protein n=1 Tax=Erwinia sp. QL-Z3 TaxID=2547962 RepID=UPI001CD96093|nr:tail fiber assembly protein [Erwinia sp. QL-Z3]
MHITLKPTLINEVSQRISVLQDAVGLELATAYETKTLLFWKKCRVILSRVNAYIALPVTCSYKPN